MYLWKNYACEWQKWAKQMKANALELAHYYAKIKLGNQEVEMV